MKKFFLLLYVFVIGSICCLLSFNDIVDAAPTPNIVYKLQANINGDKSDIGYSYSYVNQYYIKHESDDNKTSTNQANHSNVSKYLYDPTKRNVDLGEDFYTKPLVGDEIAALYITNTGEVIMASLANTEIINVRFYYLIAKNNANNSLGGFCASYNLCENAMQISSSSSPPLSSV